MTEYERALEDCLREMERGASNVDDCLARHPEHAADLKPILIAAAGLTRGRAVTPSAAFRARARANLTLHMQAHPRRGAWTGFAFRRLAAGAAAILLVLLITCTAYAQRAMPGDLFYEWKLTSELVWRWISPDPVRTDIAIANRRIEEINALADDPVRRALALEGYLEVVERLRSEVDAETLERILLIIDPIENEGQSLPIPVPAATSTPQSVVTTESPVIELPEPIATPLPEIIPTIELPPLLP